MGYQPKKLLKNSIIIDSSKIKDSVIQQGNTNATITITDGTKINGLNYDDIFEEISKRFNQVPTVEHKCHNCGGTLTMDINNHIFVCPYCNSAYAVGIQHINDKGE